MHSSHANNNSNSLKQTGQSDWNGCTGDVARKTPLLAISRSTSKLKTGTHYTEKPITIIIQKTGFKSTHQNRLAKLVMSLCVIHQSCTAQYTKAKTRAQNKLQFLSVTFNKHITSQSGRNMTEYQRSGFMVNTHPVFI